MSELLDGTSLGIVAIGFAAGVLSGMLGVGGAVLTTPGIRVLGATPIEAVGSTIPAILPAAVTGAIRYSCERLVDWRVGILCGLTGTVTAVVGAWVSDLVDAHWLMLCTAVLLAWSGGATLRQGLGAPPAAAIQDRSTEESGDPIDTADPPEARDPLTRAATPVPVLAIVGSAAGFIAGLLGVGGGIVMLPLFTIVLRMPPKQAVASSLVAVAMFSVPAMLSHAWLGHIDWRFALLLVVGTVPGARVGSTITIGSSDTSVRVMLGVLFIVVAFVFGIGELLALV